MSFAELLESGDEPQYLSIDGVTAGNVESSAVFFTSAFDGSKEAAISYLESVIETIDPLHSRKRRSIENIMEENKSKSIKLEDEGGSCSLDSSIPPSSNSQRSSVSAGPLFPEDLIVDALARDVLDSQDVTFVIAFPNVNQLASHMIGKGGNQINRIREETGVKCQIEKATPSFEPDRGLFLMGPLTSVITAYQLMSKVMGEKASLVPEGALERTEIIIPNEITSRIIGKAGMTIKKIQADSGAKVHLQSDQEAKAKPHRYGRRIVMNGTLRQRSLASYLILRVLLQDKDVGNNWKGMVPTPVAGIDKLAPPPPMSQVRMGGGMSSGPISYTPLSASAASIFAQRQPYESSNNINSVNAYSLSAPTQSSSQYHSRNVIGGQQQQHQQRYSYSGTNGMQNNFYAPYGPGRI